MHAEDQASTLPYILWAAARTRAVALYAMVSDPKEPCTASYMPWAATQTRITHRRMCHVLRPKQEPCAAVYVMHGLLPKQEPCAAVYVMHGLRPKQNKSHALPYMLRAAAQTRIALYVMGCGPNKNHALPRVSQGQRSTNKNHAYPFRQHMHVQAKSLLKNKENVGSLGDITGHLLQLRRAYNDL